MEMRQLHYFVALADEASVSRAAVKLSVAQPAISRQLRLLEEELGVTLFHRTGRGMKLTSAGRFFDDRVRKILGDLGDLEHDVRALKGVVEGKVTLGVPPTESHILLPPLLERLRHEHPGVDLRTVEAFSGDVSELLTTGHIDVALFYKAPRTRHYVADELLHESLFLLQPAGAAAPEKSPLEIADLTVYPMVLPSRRHGLRALLEQVGNEMGRKLTVEHEVDSLMTIVRMVEAGSVSTILPYNAVQREVAEGRLQATQIDPLQLRRTLVLATTTHHPVRTAMRIVAQLCTEIVQNMAANGEWKGIIPKR
ncbi:LysR family transcriptional regulator [Antarcticimicrobium luteum]|uniref:LysR family transcriptional regulator n=1 Tax=Antarcticimicrobium luteum TaxID=2547397 RepID=A0A4R5VFT8_9RHOB|nr:LysR family transcriptional regulator [Antarcticimicrobium luteum]TDK51354.1 LysR family transcriptional regulator [Antarcticimicrobium luteum]